MDGVQPAGDDRPQRAGYRRSTGSKRGKARRRELLDRVADDLAVNGLADFSLRRAARSAGTTHKVLLYYFDGADDLLGQAILSLRDRRIGTALAAATAQGPGGQTLAARVRAVWPVLMGAESGLRVLDQAMGLAMYDPARDAVRALRSYTLIPLDQPAKLAEIIREFVRPAQQSKDERLAIG